MVKIYQLPNKCLFYKSYHPILLQQLRQLFINKFYEYQRKKKLFQNHLEKYAKPAVFEYQSLSSFYDSVSSSSSSISQGSSLSSTDSSWIDMKKLL